MVEARHTPGPWSASCLDVVEGNRLIGDDGVRFWTVDGSYAEGTYRGGVCNVYQAEHIGGITIAERDANARLIAAAPDLLEALRSAAELAEVACGMTGCRSDDDFVWGVQEKIRAAIAKAEGQSND